MLDKTDGFTFEALRGRLPIFGGDLVRAVQALQREDYLALKSCIEGITVKAYFTSVKDMQEVLSKDLVVAYRYHFNELTLNDRNFIIAQINHMYLRQKWTKVM